MKLVSLFRMAQGLAAGGVALFAYVRWIRPWQLRWGATDAETYRVMPGDEVVQRPTFNATRAITINARPQDIWPWLVQIGYGRAGWYSYDWLDNFGRPSAAEIVPELQHIQIGDFIPLGPVKDAGFWVRAFEPNRWILWTNKEGDATWLWALDARDEEQTRLLTRVRLRYRWLSPGILLDLLIEFTDVAMMRKCLLGIKRRAEAATEWPRV